MTYCGFLFQERRKKNGLQQTPFFLLSDSFVMVSMFVPTKKARTFLLEEPELFPDFPPPLLFHFLCLQCVS